MHEEMINEERLLATFYEFAASTRRRGRKAPWRRRVSALLQELGAERWSRMSAGEKLGGETGNLIARVPGTHGRTAAALLRAYGYRGAHRAIADTAARQHAFPAMGTTILGADDKAGVAAIIEMLRALRETGIPRPPLEIVFTIAEEVGLMGSTVLDYSLLTAPLWLCPRRLGRGRADHQSRPGAKTPARGDPWPRGACRHGPRRRHQRHHRRRPRPRRNAPGTHRRGDHRQYRRHPRAARRRISCADIGDVGRGSAQPRPAKLEAQVTHMRECFTARGATSRRRRGDRRERSLPCLQPGGKQPGGAIGDQRRWPRWALPPASSATGGGSDANFFNGHGIQTVILSAGYHHPHGTNETLEIDQFVQLTACLYHIVRLAGSHG